MTIGESLKRFRTSLGLSQKRFADSLNLAYSLYQYYERDQTVPSAKVIIRIADTYDVSTDYLLGRSDTPHPLEADEKTINLVRAVQAFQASPAMEQVAAQ